YVSISLFQESTSLEQKLSERIFNRKPNRKAIDLGHKVEAGQIDILYMYGFLLQYEFDEGDLIAIKLTSLKDPSQTDEYFFRFHQDGAKWDVDIAFVQPIPSFHPNPGDGIQSANSTAAISFSVGKTMDPDRHYSLGGKILRSARFHITIGLLQRREVYPFNGDNITKDFFDGFGGVGFTFFDFLAVGYAANIARSPHTTFPYVGIELRHLLEFIRSLKQDTHSQWEKYLQKENEQNR
ncbi:MAG: hypothetical protein HY073_04800, partial [Deltaproteobacteria bacterium]|nr:hypothetical protein [Deltaproteobacteria bacterium]